MNIKITTSDGNVCNITNAVGIELTEDVEAVETEAEKPDWKDGSVFDIKNGNKYYYIISNGDVHKGINGRNGEFDDSAIKFGNACKDKEYAERRAKEIKLSNLLSNFAEVVNEGWKPDWSNQYDLKWFCYFDHEAHSWETNQGWFSSRPCDVYFKSEELAQRAIDEIIIPFERGEL